MDTSTLNPYPEYKSSGIEWLDDVPVHWGTDRAKWLFSKMERHVREQDDVVTCFRDGVVTLRKNRRELGFTESLQEIGYQGIRCGDLVIHAMDAFAGAIGVADSDGKSTPVYSVCKPSQQSNAYYYAHLLREMARNKWILALAKGIRQRSVDFRYSEFAKQLVPIPPLAEQTAIVRYLDHADDRISRAISAKERQIELMTEQRQATIHLAVTRGLDPNVRLKDSGVEWLGDVPEHWEVRRLKTVCNRIVGGSTPKSDVPRFWGGEVVWVTPSDVSKSTRLRTSLRKITQEGLWSCSAEVIPAGSIVVTSRAPVGNIALAETQLCTNQGCKSLVVSQDKIHSEYAYNTLNVMKFELQSKAMGTTFTELGTGTLGDLLIPLPPMDDQAAIVSYLENSTVAIDASIANAERQMVLLGEYRTRLIADVVTGQVDVRDAFVN